MHRATGRTHKAAPRAQRLRSRSRSRGCWRFGAAPVPGSPPPPLPPLRRALGRAGPAVPLRAAPYRAPPPYRSARPALASPFYSRESCERLPPAAPGPPRPRLLSPPSLFAVYLLCTGELWTGRCREGVGGSSSKLGIGTWCPHPAGKSLWRLHCNGTTHQLDAHPQANDGQVAPHPAAWPQPPSHIPTSVPPFPSIPITVGFKVSLDAQGRQIPAATALCTALSSPMLAPMSGLTGTL